VTAIRWIAFGALIWGLFTGVAYVLTPLLTEGWGNTTSTVAGLIVVTTCAIALMRCDPRGGQR
jgi:hypothetical protein